MTAKTRAIPSLHRDNFLAKVNLEEIFNNPIEFQEEQKFWLLLDKMESQVLKNTINNNRKRVCLSLNHDIKL